MDRRAKLLSDVVPDRQLGLEIGPLASAVVAKSAANRVYYVDHCKTPELIEKYRGQVPAESIAEVDIVWSRGSLREAVGDKSFDYVIASHVIEHVPDLIGWLRDISDVLVPGGILALAIPDKRYTFDVARELSTVGEVIAAHLTHQVVPSVKQVYDNYTMARAVEAASIWNGVQHRETAQYLHPRGIAGSFVERSIAGEYVDCHCWVFTPRSFLDVLKAITNEGYVSFGLRQFFDPEPGDNEFIVSLTTNVCGDGGFDAVDASGETIDNGMHQF
jgi:SAM-dependent methyltransferase